MRQKETSMLNPNDLLYKSVWGKGRDCRTPKLLPCSGRPTQPLSTSSHLPRVLHRHNHINMHNKHDLVGEKQSQKTACHLRCGGGRGSPTKFAFPSPGGRQRIGEGENRIPPIRNRSSQLKNKSAAANTFFPLPPLSLTITIPGTATGLVSYDSPAFLS